MKPVACSMSNIFCLHENQNGYVAQCWQTDPAGVIEAEIAAVAPGGGNYEAWAWDDVGLTGYTTNDADPGGSEEGKSIFDNITSVRVVTSPLDCSRLTIDIFPNYD